MGQCSKHFYREDKHHGKGYIDSERITMTEMEDRMRKSDFKEKEITKYLNAVSWSNIDHKMVRREFDDSFASWELARTYYCLEKEHGAVTVELLGDALKEEHITFILNDEILKKFMQVLMDDGKMSSVEIENAMKTAIQVKELNEVNKHHGGKESSSSPVSDQFNHSDDGSEPVPL